jgi:hypothetical protein
MIIPTARASVSPPSVLMGLTTVRMVPAGSCGRMSELIPATYNVSLLK